MKLPKFNFNDSYPLTLGVSDDYFTLSTRLKRLGRAPMQPRRRAAWLLSGALLISFVAVVPFRLTARAGNEAETAKSTVGLIHGVVIYRGSTVPLSGQIVQLRDSKGKLTQTKTNAQGKFLLRANAGKAMLWLQRDNKIAPPGLFKSKFSFVNTEIKNYSESAEGGFYWNSTATAAKLTITPPNYRNSDKDVEIDAANIIFLPVKINTKREIEIETSIKPASIGETGRLTGKISFPNGQRATATVFVSPATLPNFANSVNSWTDANRSYLIEGLKPGQYKIAVSLDDKLAKDWAAPPTSRKTIVAGTNRIDFQLTRGATINGIVVSKTSKKPIPNVEVLTADKDGDGRIVKTDARGKFRFRVAPGPIAIRLHSVGSNLKLPGFRLPSQSEYKFNLKDGDKREVRFELPKTKAVAKAEPMATKAITGIVIGPDGKPAADAAIAIRDVSSASYISWRGSVRSDANGRFTIPPKLIHKGVSLRATGSDLTEMTPRATVATAGDNVTLKLERDVAATVEGQVVDKISGAPVAGVKVLCSSPVTGSPQELITQQTDAQGRFRFEKLRPFDVSFLQFSKRDYQEDGSGTFVLQKGETRRLTIFMHPLRQTLSGRITLANSKPAGAGYTLTAINQKTQTKSDGSFFFPKVLDEKFQVTVNSPADKKSWGPFWTRGGRNGVLFGLTDARLSQEANPSQIRAQQTALNKTQLALIGQPAPTIRAQRWIVGKVPSFQDKVTLIYFEDANQSSGALNDFARSFKQRSVQVVTVEQLRPYWEFEVPANREQYLVDRARDIGVAHPVAIDAPMPKQNGPAWLTGQSHKLYRGARYVIIGRDGLIKWVGGDSGQAIAKTAAMASQ